MSKSDSTPTPRTTVTVSEPTSAPHPAVVPQTPTLGRIVLYSFRRSADADVQTAPAIVSADDREPKAVAA